MLDKVTSLNLSNVTLSVSALSKDQLSGNELKPALLTRIVGVFRF